MTKKALQTESEQQSQLVPSAEELVDTPADIGLSQTEPENGDVGTPDEEVSPMSRQDTPEPQTDPESSDAGEEAPAEPRKDQPESQTDSEMGTDETNAEPDPDSEAEEPAPTQTEPEPAELPDAEQTSQEETPDAGQTDTKTTKKRGPAKKTPTTRRRKTSKSNPESGSDAEPDNETQSGEEPKSEPRQSPSKSTRRRTPRSEPIVSIDEQRSVETDEDKLRNDILDLVESMKGRKILTGTIQGVERSADNPGISFAVVYHGAFKIIIPAEETVTPPADFRDRSPGDVMHYMVTKRLGAEVDYIVKGVDPKTGIAAASRLEAMALKRRDYYFRTDRDGNYQLYDGVSAEARVVSVIRAGIFVDLFGVEVYIPLRELSYQRLAQADSHYQPGQRVLVKILKLERSGRSDVMVAASVKQAGENPYEKALRRYTIGSRYVGTVSMVDTNGVFVSLDGGIDCLCSYPKRGRPPRGSRVTVRIIGISEDSNRIWGAITHMTTPR